MSDIISTAEFTIAANGEGYIAQRAVEKALGLYTGAISYHINHGKFQHLITNEINQLHESSLVFCCTYFANKGHKEALTMLSNLATAGARAYIYAAAGYVPKMLPVLGDESARLRTIARDFVSLEATKLSFDYRDVMDAHPERSERSVKRSINTQAKRLLAAFPQLRSQLLWHPAPEIRGYVLSARWVFTEAVLVAGFNFKGGDAVEAVAFNLQGRKSQQDFDLAISDVGYAPPSLRVV